MEGIELNLIISAELAAKLDKVVEKVNSTKPKGYMPITKSAYVIDLIERAVAQKV